MVESSKRSRWAAVSAPLPPVCQDGVVPVKVATSTDFPATRGECVCDL